MPVWLGLAWFSHSITRGHCKGFERPLTIMNFVMIPAFDRSVGQHVSAEIHSTCLIWVWYEWSFHWFAMTRITSIEGRPWPGGSGGSYPFLLIFCRRNLAIDIGWRVIYNTHPFNYLECAKRI